MVQHLSDLGDKALGEVAGEELEGHPCRGVGGREVEAETHFSATVAQLHRTRALCNIEVDGEHPLDAALAEDGQFLLKRHARAKGCLWLTS